MSRKMIDYKVEDGKITSIDGYKVVGGGTAVEANPQEEATQQLEKIKIDNITYSTAGGGGGNYNVAITKFASTYTGSGSTYNARWSNGNLQPNTAYEIGMNFYITFTTDFEKRTIGSNQIFVATNAHPVISENNYTLKYGDVVLELTSTKTTMRVAKYADDGRYQATAYNTLVYTVIKAGTTGESTNIPNSGWYSEYTYQIYDLGVVQAAQ